MTKPPSRRAAPKMSPALRRAIAADAIGCPVDEEVLAPRDVAALKAILADEREPAIAISRKHAFGALARSDPSAETGALLGQALADRTLPPRDRLAAAAYLGWLPPAAAEPALLAALSSASGLLRLEIVKSLGQAGGAKALARLSRLDPESEDIGRRQLTFARSVIGLRERRGDGLASALGVKWRLREAEPLAAKAVREIVAALGGARYDMPINPDTGLAFECGGVRHVLLLNAALRRGGFADAALKDGMIAGLVVARAEKLPSYGVRWLLLTSPGKQGLDILLARTNGDIALAGSAEANAEGLRFTLRDTGIERTPVEVVGHVTNDEIGWTMRVWRGALRDKAHPRAILVNAPAPAPA